MKTYLQYSLILAAVLCPLDLYGQAPPTEVDETERPSEYDRTIELLGQARKAGDQRQVLRLSKRLADMEAAELQQLARTLGEGRKASAAFVALSARVIKSYSHVAKLQERLADWDSARMSLQQAVQVARDAYGQDDWRTGDAERSLAQLEVERQLTSEQRQRLATVDQLNAKMAQEYRRGNYVATLEVTKEMLQITKEVLGTEHLDYVACLADVATVYSTMGNYSAAEELYAEVLAARTRLLENDHPDIASTLDNIGVLRFDQGNYTAAATAYQRALVIRKEALGERHPRYATTLNNMAMLHKRRGDFAAAERMLRESLSVKEQLGENHIEYITSLTNVADVYMSKGDLAHAESTYLRCIELFERANFTRHPNYATSLSGLAGVYRLRGDYARAEAHIQSALNVVERAVGKRHPKYAEFLNNLAVLHRRAGHMPKAYQVAKDALEIRRGTVGESHLDFAASLKHLADVAFDLDDLATAEQNYLQALRIIETATDRGHMRHAACTNSLGQLYFRQGKFDEARASYADALEVTRNTVGDRHMHYGRVLENAAQLDFAEEKYSAAYKKFYDALQISLAGARSIVPALSEPEAISWVNKNQPRGDWLLSVLRRAELADARTVYDAIWQTKSLASRLRYRRMTGAESPEVQRQFDELHDARLRLARLVSATPSAENAAAYRAALANANLAKERLEKQLIAGSPTIGQWVAMRDASIQDLLDTLPSNVAVIDFVVIDDWHIVDQNDPANSADDSASAKSTKRAASDVVVDAFVLRSDRPTADQVAWLKLGEATLIRDALTQWTSHLTGRTAARGLGTAALDLKQGDSSASVSGPQDLLRQAIWEKLEPHLRGCDTVILVPHSFLHRLPWSALPGRKRGSYLVEDYALVTASSGQDLFDTLSRSPIDTSPSLLVAGAVDYSHRASNPEQPQRREVASGRVAWPKLRGTAREIEAIRTTWGGERIAPTVVVEGDASEVRLARALPEHRYVHLATHGFFEESTEVFGVNLRNEALFGDGGFPRASAAARNPLLMNGLVLAGANLGPVLDRLGLPISEDGILTAEEIIGLDLRKLELVTLSACETGLGDISNSEGVFGLQRAFRFAGARTVIGSLWKVDDAATEALMTDFYTNLWAKRMGKLEALRAAQLKMLQRYDAKSGTIRGLGATPVDLDDGRRDSEARASHLSPYYWAAFQLNGDWR